MLLEQSRASPLKLHSFSSQKSHNPAARRCITTLWYYYISNRMQRAAALKATPIGEQNDRQAILLHLFALIPGGRVWETGKD
jgi:hypothetical protein